MKRVFIFACILFVLPDALLLSQAKNPELPLIPEIVNESDNSGYKKNVKVAIQGKGIIPGEIFFNSDALTTRDSLVPDIRIAELSKITVISWGKHKRNKSYIFFPSKYEVLFRDSRKIIIDGNIPSINRLKLRINNRIRYFYMFYYDNYKKNKWINSGLTDFNSVFIKPADGCITSIEVIQ